MFKLGQRSLLFFALGWLGLSLGPLSAEEPLVWRAADNRMDADIRSLPLPEFLEKLAARTGWEIYVEPEAERTISAKFKNLPPGDALKFLLGNLNFALLPQKNAPPSLFVFSTSMKEATRRILPPPPPGQEPGIIPNELIVSLKPGSDVNIDDLARKLGAKVVGRADGLNSYRLQFEDEDSAAAARKALAEHSEVASVDSNFMVPRPAEPFSLGFGMPGVPFNLKPNPAGADQLLVGIIDTAVNKLDSGIEAFIQQRLALAGEFTPDGLSPTHGDGMVTALLQALSAANSNPDGSSVRLILADAYGTQPHTTTFEVGQSIWALVNDHGVKLINMSLGSSGNSDFLHQIIRQAHQNDVVMFGPAGNEPGTAPTYPAAHPEVLAVTAQGRDGNLAPYANRGPFVELIAPGSALLPFGDRSYYINGTSVSSAYAAGFAAGYSERTGTPVNQVPAHMRNLIGVKPPSPAQ